MKEATVIKDVQIECSPQVKYLVGKITPDTVKELCSALTTRKPTILLIDSGGGEFDSGSLLAGSILNNDKVVGIISGKVNSMAIPVFQSCKVRIMVDSATMFFHSGEWTWTMPNLAVFNADRIARQIKEKQEEETAYEEMVLKGVKPDKSRAKEFQLTLETIREWRRKEYTLTAQDALKYGLCDAVLPFQNLFAPEVLNG